MRIGHGPEFIFLSNPKCGSTSIRVLMNKYSDISAENNPQDPTYLMHVNAYELKTYFEHENYKDKTVGPWDSYYKFTTVRNPWKKMVSYYFFSAPDKEFRSVADIRQKIPVLGAKREEPIKYDPSTAFYHGFNPWLKHVMDGHGLPHYEYFCCDHDDPEKCLVDDVFKIEEIDEVLAPALKEHLNIEIKSVPDLNPDMGITDLTSRYFNWKGDYYSLYNEESQNIVAQVYCSDIDNFNYKFGE